MEKQVEKRAQIDELLTAKKLQWFAKNMAIAYLAIWGLMVMTGPGLVDSQGRPKGTDYLALYAAGRMAVRDAAASAYSMKDLHKERMSVIPKIAPKKLGVSVWPYPPPYFFVAAPLAMLPYLLGYVLWVSVTLLIYLRVLYRWHPSKLTIWAVLAAPAVFMNFAQGQTGFMIGAILAGGLLLLDKRPFAAGLVMGLLIFKPQFAVAPFLVLLLVGNWRAICGGIVSAGALSLASIPAFGTASWVGMMQGLSSSMAGVSKAVDPLHKYATVLGFGRLLGLPDWLAWGLQGAVALAALVVMLQIWRRTGSVYYRAASLTAGVFLMTPYAHDYDMAVLLLGLIALGVEMTRGVPAKRWEKLVLLANYATPIAAPAVAMVTKVQLMPLGVIVLLWLIYRRVKEEVAAGAPDAAAPAENLARA